jgi:ADP-ribose pyrophosphatase YjhB (NUDIX family)
MVEHINSLVGSTLLCHYGETHDVFPIGGLVQPGETLTNAAIRHCHHLVNFRVEKIDRLYI